MENHLLNRHTPARLRPGLDLSFLCPESLSTMQALQSVLDKMPAGGIVKYNTYRHPSIIRSLDKPHSENKDFWPFLRLLVVLIAPLAYDEETGACYFDEANEVVLGVTPILSPGIMLAKEHCPEGYCVICRYLCQPS